MKTVSADNLVIHFRLMKALYAAATPFNELEQIWTLVEYIEAK